MIIYLAGPVRSAGMVNSNGWRQALAKAVGQYGVVCFNPAASWNPAANLVITSERQEQRIKLVNDAALLACNLVVVAYQPVWSEASRGTDAEISLARDANKPMVVYLPSEDAYESHQAAFNWWKHTRFPKGSADPSVRFGLDEISALIISLAAVSALPEVRA